MHAGRQAADDGLPPLDWSFGWASEPPSPDQAEAEPPTLPPTAPPTKPPAVPPPAPLLASSSNAAWADTQSGLANGLVSATQRGAVLSTSPGPTATAEGTAQGTGRESVRRHEWVGLGWHSAHAPPPAAPAANSQMRPAPHHPPTQPPPELAPSSPPPPMPAPHVPRSPRSAPMPPPTAPLAPP